MKLLRASIAVLLTFFLPLAASAMDVSGQSRTYLLSRETADSMHLMPLYEYLDFKAESAGAGASFNFGGWARQDLMDASTDTRSNNDLQYAYLRLRRNTGNAFLDIGRVRVREGVASDLVDGAYGRTDLKGGFSIAVYGGSPVVESTVTSVATSTIPAANSQKADSIYGGRVSHSIPGLYAIGLSFLDEKDHNTAFRREGGVDLWFRPFNKLELQGLSSYNDISRNWMQHNYYLTIGPFGGFRLIGTGSMTSYKDYFTGSTMSAFTFPSINPDETVTSTGGSLEYAFTSSLTAIADYKNFNYKIAGNADYYGGKISYAGDSFGAGISIHRMNGESDRLRYDEQSLYISKKIAKADISVQAIRIAYSQEINGVKDAYNVAGAAGYSFTPKARVVADVEYSENPDFNSDVRSMLTFVYRFDAKFERQTTKKTDSKKS
jgi:hypothetical protein